MQGLAFDSAGRLWASEFGQNRFDEINLIRAGKDYGWPIVEGPSDDPRFAAPLVTHGRPRVFVSHGTDDRVLPIDVCSRRLVPRLHTLGYPAEYAEFAGGHEVPAEIRRRAVDWLVG